MGYFYDSGLGLCVSQVGIRRCEAQIFPGNACPAGTSSCITNANCVAGFCKCIAGSYYFDSTTGQCKALKAFGVACTEHEQCATGFRCLSNICQCLPNQYYNGVTCITSATFNSAT